ncbi:hypothetical protein P691DRAFT_671645 [Macrolepiota fuliginosa MF-IS2]|uniref:RING-type domain-containing protein n=1 Tax=Macrolepiota fuliginosa MF-IS2 TaxID=1400762 RepID=A0A9P5X9U5_9AGAR|nr:hypothetical protein P691DRAFT_671645 [Macrolepiota fuliginosa MF-IS2]
MLSLGLGSACDVCLESFGPDAKGPCSIQCGHVFCVDCLNHLERPQCPLCRDPFEPHSVVRLHIDVEQRSSPKAPPPRPTAAEQEARRLQDAIANVANTGSSEPNLRSLIGEGRKFLSNQPRNLFPELRMAHRMIAYLCEVKANLVAQTQACNALQAQVSQLGAEKGELEKRIQDLKGARKYERQTALTVERNLRDHCSRAHEAYETVVE